MPSEKSARPKLLSAITWTRGYWCSQNVVVRLGRVHVTAPPERPAGLVAVPAQPRYGQMYTRMWNCWLKMVNETAFGCSKSRRGPIGSAPLASSARLRINPRQSACMCCESHLAGAYAWIRYHVRSKSMCHVCDHAHLLLVSVRPSACLCWIGLDMIACASDLRDFIYVCCSCACVNVMLKTCLCFSIATLSSVHPSVRPCVSRAGPDQTVVLSVCPSVSWAGPDRFILLSVCLSAPPAVTEDRLFMGLSIGVSVRLLGWPGLDLTVFLSVRASLRPDRI